jgi:enterochelin esterase-like enzyme
MRPARCTAWITVILAWGIWLAQPGRTANDQAPQAGGAPARAGAGAIVLGPDDKPAFPDPPAGFNSRRDDIPHGEMLDVQYDSRTLGTRRQIRVYLPPGYSKDRKYPSIYLQHGLGWNDLEWTRVRHADIVMDNLIADRKVLPMVMIFPNGDSSMTAADIA